MGKGLVSARGNRSDSKALKRVESHWPKVNGERNEKKNFTLRESSRGQVRGDVTGARKKKSRKKAQWAKNCQEGKVRGQLATGRKKLVEN